jgi:hypothetical protein
LLGEGGSVEDILANPHLLSGFHPQAVEQLIADTPGWRVETLRRGSRRGSGWVLREYDGDGNPTGSVIRWHPGGGPPWRRAVLASRESALWSIRGDSMSTVADNAAQQALLEQLIVAVSRLARPAQGQIAYLRTLDPGGLADELALEFDDVQGAVLPLLSDEPRQAVEALDDQLSKMTAASDGGLWTHESLEASSSWGRVRVLARDALASLHAEPVIPPA